jgi:hypothetical protein
MPRPMPKPPASAFEPLDQRHRVERLAVQRHGHAALEADAMARRVRAARRRRRR